MKIETPIRCQMIAKEYHSDPCPTASLSSSILDKLINQSPKHAWAVHPRFNPNHYGKATATAMEKGSAAHAIILEGRDSVQVIDSENWRTKDAREQRDQAHQHGRFPLLKKDYEDIKNMHDVCFEQLDATMDCGGVFRGGVAEESWFWKSDDAWLRCRPDWYDPQGDHIIYDYKTTSGSAHPDVWGKKLYDHGNDIRAAFYAEGAKELLGWHDCIYRFVVQETKPPYALSVIQLDPAALNLAQRRFKKGLSIWKQCLAADKWPGFPAQIAHVDAPAWMELNWQDREARDHFNKQDGKTEIEAMIHWQSPLNQGGKNE